MALLLALVVVLTTGWFPHAQQGTAQHAPIAHPADTVGGMSGG
jgi:hypothetical protein